ncbi:unnamed protein product [Strongylus vulgaris]|uniref:Uncharacterized protein n=1 Tax=Strongylus vulgaris TaxID=40348 RepID=A0A3P7IW49_STRVU|nr:unnamed protein product [Strongylus vulgaris]
MTGPEIVDYINTHQSYFKAKYRPGVEEFVKARIMKEKYLDDPLAKLSEPKEALGDEPIPTR